MQTTIHINDLNDIFNEHLGQTYEESLDDQGGCYMGRNNRTWMSPEVICALLGEVLDLVDVKIEGLDELLAAKVA